LVRDLDIYQNYISFPQHFVCIDCLVAMNAFFIILGCVIKMLHARQSRMLSKLHIPFISVGCKHGTVTADKPATDFACFSWITDRKVSGHEAK